MRARFALLVAVFSATLAFAAPAGALTVGIADNKADMFFDPRFAASGIGRARISIGWDALSSPWQTQQLDQWLWLPKSNHACKNTSFSETDSP